VENLVEKIRHQRLAVQEFWASSVLHHVSARLAGRATVRSRGANRRRLMQNVATA
jgi:hypothetical protein